MKKIFRWFVIFTFGLLVILGIGSGLAWYYKPEITAAIHQKLKENINGDYNIDDIRISIFDDFPAISITLQGIFLRDSLYSFYKKDFLTAQKILLHVSGPRLLFKNIDVKSIKVIRGEVFVFRTKSGYTNLDLFRRGKPSTDSSDNIANKLSLHEIDFEDVNLTFRDSLKGKSFGVLLVKGKNKVAQTDSSHQFRYAGRIDFDRLQFNTAKGSYLLGTSSEVNLNCEYIPRRHHLRIQQSTLKFSKSTVGVSGAFTLTPTGKFSLDFNSENLNYSEGLSLLPLPLASKLAKYKVEQPFGIKVAVKGELKPGSQPAVDVDFTIKDSPVVAGKYTAQHVSMKGSFTNHLDDAKVYDDKNSTVRITTFNGLYNGLPMNIQASFNNLEDPDVDLKITIDVEARSLQRELDPSVYQIGGGRFSSQVRYSGKLKEYLDPTKSRFDGKLNGRTELKNVKFTWAAKNITLENVNASIAFTESKFVIESFAFKFNQNPVAITGSVIGFVPFFSVPSKKGVVRLQVSSPELNLTPILVKGLKKQAINTRAQEKKMISDLIDKLYSKLEFELILDVGQFQYRNFKASGITGNISLANSQLRANPIKMKLAETLSSRLNYTTSTDPLIHFSYRESFSRRILRTFFMRLIISISVQ